jgi:hypothetical protein
MNNESCLRKKIGHALNGRVSRKRLPAYMTDKKYQEEPEYAEAIPFSRWHNIELEWDGKRYRFQMNINDHPLYGGDIRLGHVYDIDPVNDEWVEAPREILDRARNDPWLMAKLRADVDAFEGSRDVIDSINVPAVSPHEPPPAKTEPVWDED